MACQEWDNVHCDIQDGLTVDAAKKVGAKFLVRGIRNSVDLGYEQNMDYMNQSIDATLDTVCFLTKPEYMYCTSTNVRECIKYDLDFSQFVPDCVWKGWKENGNID